jgi:hypothetical protein
MYIEILWGNLLENSYLEDQEGNGRITLRWISWKEVMMANK